MRGPFTATGSPRLKGIKYVSLGDTTGYGTAARRQLLALKRAGIPFTWTPMVLGPGWGLGYEPFAGRRLGDAELDAFCNRPLAYDTVILHTVPEYYPRWIARERGKRILGSTVWETDRLPGPWPALLDRTGGLIVPCRWNREVFRASGVTKPVHVVPHLPDRPRDEARAALPCAVRPDDLVFYTIGTWTVRKAVEHTIRAYLDAFTARDPVVLIVKTSPRDLSPPRWGRRFRSTRRLLRKITRRYPTPARVVLITRELGEAEIRALHRRGDCFISLCRSEGWGLGAYDAAARGRPVIMTGYGGQRDFLPPDRAYLVDFDLVPIRASTRLESYGPGQHWAEPDLAHATRLLREVFRRPDEARQRGRRLQQYVEEHFTTPAVLERFLQAIEGRPAAVGV